MENQLEQKITKAQERIESLYYETKGHCYLSFSGGKDSMVVLALIKQCEEIYTIPKAAIPAVFCDTGIELGATRDFVLWCKENYYQNVQVIRPQVSFDWIVKNKGKPIKSKLKSEFIERYKNNKNSKALYYLLGEKNYQKTKLADKDIHILHDNFDIKISNSCCEYLKKKPFLQYQKEHEIKGYFTGIRNAEGGARELATIKRLKNNGKICIATKAGCVVKMPIIDWTNDDVEQFIKKYEVPLSKAYTKYELERTGCFLCPFSLQLKKNLEKLYIYEPSRYKAAMYWLKDVYIAQNVNLEFDEQYEKERIEKWITLYSKMCYEMLQKYRPQKADKFKSIQMSLF